ncbi:unnamed protein product, partial [Polarella glacialis]
VPVGGGATFSPEWYAEGKDRQKKRDLEILQMLDSKAKLRTEWAEVIWDDLGSWAGKIDAIVNTLEPLAELQALTARTKHERPGDKFRFEQLLDFTAQAEQRQLRVRKELHQTRESLTKLEEQVRAKEVEGAAAEV